VKLFPSRVATVSPADASAAHQRKELVLIDVRQPQEWQSGVASGALLIALSELPSRIEDLPQGQPLAFLCRSGHRSSVAARQARRHGFEVLSVSGGMTAWQRAGLPTTAVPRNSRARA